MNHTGVVDVAIAGAGIIGLSLALELRQRGLSVTVMERGQAMSSASWAAGGMLAVNDPQNPAELMPLCVRSWELYPAYLQLVESLSGLRVPLRTRRTLQEATLWSQGERACDGRGNCASRARAQFHRSQLCMAGRRKHRSE